jgi:glycosyltransferase involved in cell wall biosynthesis
MTRPLGVCHIASGDRWAGAEVQVATLLKYLARDPRFQIHAIVLNRGRLAKEIEGLGIPAKVIPEAENGLLDIVRVASHFLAGRNVRIIHSHRYKENLIGAWLARRCKIPHLVQTQHGLPEPLSGIRALKQRLIHSLNALVTRHASDRVIGVSSDVTRWLADRVKPQKLVTIPNGVDLESVRSNLTAQEARQRLGISPQGPVIGTAGRLEPIKRLDIFLKAAAEIVAQRPDAKFVIAGEGREQGALTTLAKALGIADRVLFLGHRNDAYDVLRAFDALVLSSDHEGLPMVLLEALCLGVPVVARTVGGIPEVIQSSVNGILVDSSDPKLLAQACLLVLSNPINSEGLIEGGIRTVKGTYSAAQTAGQVAQLYFSLVLVT